DVGDHGVELLPLGLVQCGLAVLGLVHGIAGGGQGKGDHLPHGGGIVDDQQLCAHAVSPVVLACIWGDRVLPRLASSASRRTASSSAGEAWVRVVLRPAAARARTQACSSCRRWEERRGGKTGWSEREQ